MKTCAYWSNAYHPVDREVRTMLCRSHRHRIAIASHVNSCVRQVCFTLLFMLSLDNYNFHIPHLFHKSHLSTRMSHIVSLNSENGVYAGLVLFKWECSRYRLHAGLVWCICWYCDSVRICNLKRKTVFASKLPLVTLLNTANYFVEICSSLPQ
jgi:hypothetical protein